MSRILIIICIVVIIFSSCDISNKNGQLSGTVQFSLFPGTGKNTFRNYINDAMQVIVTIEDTTGNIIYDNHIIDLINFGGEFISSPLSLNPGNYCLSKFLVTNEKNIVIFASPLEDAANSYLVNNPLPIDFSINAEMTIKISPEVLDTENSQANDFGYTTFELAVIKTFDFRISTFVYDKNMQNLVLTSTTVSILAENKVIYNSELTANTNKIIINDGYANYEIIVKKEGYNSFSSVFDNMEMKSFLSDPLKVILTESLIRIGEFEFAKLLLECTSSNEGWTSISLTKYHNEWIFSYSVNVEHWNHSNTRIYSIPIDLTGEPALRSTLAYNNHPYIEVFNFRARNASIFTNEDVLYLAYCGNNVNLGGGYSTVIASSQDTGFTWDKYNVIYQAQNNREDFIGSVFQFDNEYALYYNHYNYGSSDPIEYYYDISSMPLTFNIDNPQPINQEITGIGDISYNTILQIDNKYLGFYKEQIDGEFCIFMAEADNPAFANMSNPVVVMCPGISQYDLFDITPSFYLDKDKRELYCIAIVDPRERQDYGFDNDSAICFYKAPIL